MREIVQECKVLTLAKGIEFTNNRSQDEQWFCQLIDEIDRHTTGTDEDVGDGKIYEIEIDRCPQGSVEGNGDDDAEIACQGNQNHDKSDDNFDVLNMGKGLKSPLSSWKVIV